MQLDATRDIHAGRVGHAEPALAALWGHSRGAAGHARVLVWRVAACSRCALRSLCLNARAVHMRLAQTVSKLRAVRSDPSGPCLFCEGVHAGALACLTVLVCSAGPGVHVLAACMASVTPAAGHLLTAPARAVSPHGSMVCPIAFQCLKSRELTALLLRRKRYDRGPPAPDNPKKTDMRLLPAAAERAQAVGCRLGP